MLAMSVSMMTVDIAVSELAMVGELCVAQLDAGVPADEVHENMFGTWRANLQSLASADGTQKRALMGAINSYTNWPAGFKRDLIKTVANIGVVPTCTDHDTDRTRVNGKGPKTQLDLHFHNKLTEADWNSLRTYTTDDAVIGLISLRAWLVCLVNPSEKTLYHMVAIVARIFNDRHPTQTKTKDLMGRLQRAIKARGKRDGFPYMLEYPKSAAGMPDKIRTSAYQDQTMPVDVDIPELHTILGGTKMRQHTGMSWLTHVPAKMRPMLTQAMSSNRRLLGLGDTDFDLPTGGGNRNSARDSPSDSARKRLALGNGGGGGDGQHSDPNARSSGAQTGPTPPGAAAKAPVDADDDDDHDDTDHKGDGDGDGDPNADDPDELAEMEKHMLGGPPTTAKAKAKAKAKGKAAATGKVAVAAPPPAGKAGAVMKKPCKAPAKGGRQAAKGIIVASGAKPKMMVGTLANPGPTVKYLHGKICVSWTRGCFRVFRDLTKSNPSDVSVLWKNYDTKEDAWASALKLIRDSK